MSLPHLLMLGLLPGATVGVVAQPPVTVGELVGLAIDQFYVVSSGQNAPIARRPLTAAQYRQVQRMAAIQRRSKLAAIVDYRTQRELMREMRARLR